MALVRSLRAVPERWLARLTQVASVIALLVSWELLADAGTIDARLLSSPSRIYTAGQDMLADGTFLHHLAVSAQEFLWGYALAAVVGSAIGITAGWSRSFNTATKPFVTFFYVVPQVAFLPLVLVWFGFGLMSKVTLVFLATFPTVLFAARTGVRTVDPRLVRCGRAFGGSQLRILRSVVLPAAVPSIISGLRVATGRCLVGVVVAELIGATAGIGYLIATSGSRFQADSGYFAVLVLGCIGLLMNALLGGLERRFDSWRPIS
jgi:ABC-type nitrate/sulfonate/bicarbonate transport system permease component